MKKYSPNFLIVMVILSAFIMAGVYELFLIDHTYYHEIVQGGIDACEELDLTIRTIFLCKNCVELHDGVKHYQVNCKTGERNAISFWMSEDGDFDKENIMRILRGAETVGDERQ